MRNPLIDSAEELAKRDRVVQQPGVPTIMLAMLAGVTILCMVDACVRLTMDLLPITTTEQVPHVISPPFEQPNQDKQLN